MLGLPMELVERTLPLVTVYSGLAKVDVLEAAPEVIAALPEITAERLNLFLAQRQAAPGDGQGALAAPGSRPSICWYGGQQGIAGERSYRVRRRAQNELGSRHSCLRERHHALLDFVLARRSERWTGGKVAMKILSAIGQGFSYWIESVAETVIAVHGWLAPARVIKLVEGNVGEFTVLFDQQINKPASTSELVRIADGKIIDTLPAGTAENVAGSRIELVLRADRFLFAPLELPGRAAEFLDGVVRAQIDRLTPWGAAEAAFGWSKLTETGSDRFITTIAATALGRITPFVQAVASLGARSISVFTCVPEAGPEAALIKVFQGGARGAVDVGRIRHALKFIVIAAGVGAGAAVSAWEIAGVSLDAQQEELTDQIASARAAASAKREAPVGSITAAHRILEQFKHEAPSSVIVLDTLSQILPDHTYVTELRIEDNKLRLTGVTKDAPSLISLIEQSGRFTRATFSAPTTQSPSEPGERFHIEAEIAPLVPPRS